MPELVDAVPAVALAVYAHPDDAEVSCGGTLARWAAEGAEVHVVVITDGGKGTSDPAVRVSELVERRRGEMEESSTVLGLAARAELAYPDGEIDNTVELREVLVAVVRSVRPQIVICPDPTAAFFGQEYVNHRDHRVAGWATIDAVSPAASLPLYFPLAGPPHSVEEMYLSGTLAPDVAVDIGGTVEAKVRALQCHRSQIGSNDAWVDSFVRRRAEEVGRTVGVAFAEAFRRQRVGA